jgi:uncharacterized membrane protein YsdA (DUF1294 family)
MAALCYFIIAQGEQTLFLLSIMGGGDGSIVLRRQSWRHRTQPLPAAIDVGEITLM